MWQTPSEAQHLALTGVFVLPQRAAFTLNLSGEKMWEKKGNYKGEKKIPHKCDVSVD